MTLTTEKYTEGLCGDGAAILCDGVPMSVSEILATLNAAVSREAQPVAWRHDDGPFAGIAITRAKSVADSWIAKGWTVTPLYTAPPAPANVRAVAWEMRFWNSGYGCWSDWERITEDQHTKMSVWPATGNNYEFRVLYDAPPAPAPAPTVPEEMTAPRAFAMLMNKGGAMSPVDSAVFAWNACRAAMLAQPVSGDYKFQDGWIACSERMPECGKWDHSAVIVSEGNNSFIAYYNKRDGEFLDEPFGASVGNKVTHWMPLPAAPEGGDDA